MKPDLATVLKTSPDPERARRFFESLEGVAPARYLESLSTDQARILAALAGGSQILGNLLVAHPDWLESIDAAHLQFPRREQGLRKELGALTHPSIQAGDFAAALERLREFKQREMLRIAARDLARLGMVSEITRELSDVADVCLGGVWEICQRQLAARLGRPWHQDAEGRWQPTGSSILGLGKLGGQELNYSSDVDVIFVYAEEGQVFREPPAKGKAQRPVMPNHQFYKRLAEAYIAEVSRMTPAGMLFRIDLRLRPEGDAGPLTRSLASYENYYAQWGQTWERMMLIKARAVAGDEGLAGEFLEMIQPFRYPRTIDAGVIREIGAMKDRIENEVVRSGEIDRNVKLGRGGIREIEFLAQSQQLLHAGGQPFLQCSQTLPCLGKLAQYNLLSGEEAEALGNAYRFLRDVEHRLQMEENLQTHTIPVARPAREPLARLMGCDNGAQFEAELRRHTGEVRRIFDRHLKSDETPAAVNSFPLEFAGAEEAWKQLLAEHSFQDPNKAFLLLREFVEGPGYVHISPRTSGLAYKLLPRLLARCPARSTAGGPGNADGPGPGARGDPRCAVLSDPDRVVARLDSFIAAYGARATLFELWNSNPAIFELLILLFDRSEFLAELAIRTPDMVDELVTSGRLRRRKSAEETLNDLRHGLGDADQHLWLRRYHHTELMRIGLRDILGLTDFEQYLQELSSLADACLQYALEVVMRNSRIRRPPFAIIGLGKLGGAEIDYGSDLDIVFVVETEAKRLQHLHEMAVQIMDLVSRRTEAGLVFHTDARLRPDGEKGLLVNTLDAFEEYYRRRAQLWEIQSLTRARAVAGGSRWGSRFEGLAGALTDFRPASVAAGFRSCSDRSSGGAKAGGTKSGPVGPNEGLAAYTPGWKAMIHRMRMRIERERTPAGKDELSIKTGRGGVMDAEFVAQALCLENGWREANTLRALERGRDSGALADADKLIVNYRELRRVEGILRRWSYEGETVLPDEPEAYYRVAVRCGFATPEAFRSALAAWRKGIRKVYQRALGR